MADAKETKVAETAEVPAVVKAPKSTAPAKISELAAVLVAGEPAKIDLSAFEVEKIVTRPVLRLVDLQPVIFRADAAMFEGKALEGSKMAPATLMNVTDCVTGAASQVVVPKVLNAELDAAYPDDSYVGKFFGVEKQPQQAGKKYSNYRIVELAASNFNLPAAQN